MKIPKTFRFVKIVVFAPTSHAEKIRLIMARYGAGKLGNYDSCSFSTKGIGRFRGNEKAKPYIGKKGKVEKVSEERIEMICPRSKVETVISAIRKNHPYEEPAIEVYPLLHP